MNDNYGEQIKRYRINLGMTQNQVATKLDIAPGYISNVENGRTAMSLKNTHILCEINRHHFG